MHQGYWPVNMVRLISKGVHTSNNIQTYNVPILRRRRRRNGNRR